MSAHVALPGDALIQWPWIDLCGPDGFQFWSPENRDIGLCFQKLCLQIPVLIVLAILSAYFYGSRSISVKRPNGHVRALNVRALVVMLLSVLPLLHLLVKSCRHDGNLSVVDLALFAVECLTWLCHFGYVTALRSSFGLCARGPVNQCVIWTLLAVLHVIMFRSNFIIMQNINENSSSLFTDVTFGGIRMVLHFMYLLTLLPSKVGSYFVTYDSLPSVTSNGDTSSFPYHHFNYGGNETGLGVAMEDNNWLSKLFFYWVNPLMKKGSRGALSSTDELFDLPSSLSISSLTRKLEHKLQLQYPISNGRTHSEDIDNDSTAIVSDSRNNNDRISLLKFLHQCFGLQFYSIGILKFIADSTGFAGPLLLNKLVSFIENKDDNYQMGYLYTFGLLGTSLLSAFCNQHFTFLMQMVCLKFRATLVTLVYRKTLTSSGPALNAKFSVGEILNFISTDTDRIVNLCPTFHTLWSIPFQVVLALYLLYLQVGSAFLAGTIFTIILIPINKIIANQIQKQSTQMMKWKDERVKMMMESLRGMRAIKIHVWESYFLNVINELRSNELKYLKWRKYLDALCVYLWATTPILFSLFTFGTYVWMNNELTAATVFTTIALLNMLIGPLNAFPWVLNGLTEAWVSIKRIQTLLDLPDSNVDVYYNTIVPLEENVSIRMKNADFNYEESTLHEDSEPAANFLLHGIELDIFKGELIGVMGPVASGKSSLLSALMAEIIKMDGEVIVSNIETGFGFVSQQVWLQRGTVRDNIIFGQYHDKARYNRVVHACGLEEDFKSLSKGDMTGVGDGGATLSGGQKARIALARAVYQDKNIYLLDDIISAVDPHVAKHIFQHCILDVLKEKTVVLCTHSIDALLQCDRVIVLEHGQIKAIGDPEEVVLVNEDLRLSGVELSGTHSKHENDVEEEMPIVPADTDSLINEELSERGTIAMHVYATYWKSIGHVLSVVILLSITLMQASRNTSDLWLSYWVSDTANGTNTNNSMFGRLFVNSDDNNRGLGFYFGIYVAIAVLNSAFTLLRSFLFAYGGIKAARVLHKNLVNAVFKSKVVFFDITPIGRIINRFSSDTYTVDDSLPFMLNVLLAILFGLIGCVVVTIYGLPWLCLILLPLVPIYQWLQNHYRLTSRELKRLSSVTLSPIYNNFSDTLQGLSTIRAFRAMNRFRSINMDLLEKNLKANFATQAASQWLGLRLQFIGVAIVSSIGVIAVIQHQYDEADPGFIGLAITYALAITSLLNVAVSIFTETEREMVALERIKQYFSIEPESEKFKILPNYAWPQQGVIIFKNVELKYRDNLSNALKDISFEIRPAEKIGVVGRTGAGKSSIINALFRLTELSSGTIFIDNINISEIALSELRSRLCCIPQDPFLYSATIRNNLDPLNKFHDSEIWIALDKVNLKSTIQSLDGQLLYEIKSCGTNFSLGQRQLFCLARALLQTPRIICIDEATANVDQECDKQIQRILRSSFRSSTVITIAHRVQTVIDCDRVIVMGEGEILEFDKPDVLSARKSHFYRLIHE